MTKRMENYEGNWRNVDDECMLCEMDKRTEWYLETSDWVIAEKLSSGPFVVYKKHVDELSEEEWNDMERVVNKLFDDFHLEVKMNLVPDHFHAHILTDDDVDLSGE